MPACAVPAPGVLGGVTLSRRKAAADRRASARHRRRSDHQHQRDRQPRQAHAPRADRRSQFATEVGEMNCRVIARRPARRFAAWLPGGTRVLIRKDQDRGPRGREYVDETSPACVGSPQWVLHSATLPISPLRGGSGGPGCPATKDDLLHAVSRSTCCQASVTRGARRIRHPRSWRARRARLVVRPSASGARSRARGWPRRRRTQYGAPEPVAVDPSRDFMSSRSALLTISADPWPGVVTSSRRPLSNK